MADFNSSLPIRTEANGDAAVKVVDGTITSQVLGVDASGRVTSRIVASNGDNITSTVAGAKNPVDALLRDAAGVVFGTATNPIAVSLTVDSVGDEIVNYDTSAAIAGGASDNHDYTVSVGKTLLLKQVEASGSGRAKVEVQVESGVATDVFATQYVQFNSTSTPNMSVLFSSPVAVAAGVRVRIIRTNRDNQAQDLYSTILGQEV